MEKVQEILYRFLPANPIEKRNLKDFPEILLSIIATGFNKQHKHLLVPFRNQ
jgi:hypothetical protein